MKKLSKKTLIPIGILTIICLIVIIGYKGYSTSKAISEFSTYLDEYKQVITTYILTDNEEMYDELIKESEQFILAKESKKIEESKLKLNKLKEELLEINIELVNKSISELEAIDIGKLDNKESIISKIEDIKKLIADERFITANDEFISLKSDINSNLEIIRLQEIKVLEEEYKKAEEEKKIIEQNTFNPKKALEYLSKYKQFDFINTSNMVEYVGNSNSNRPGFEFSPKDGNTTVKEIYFYEKSDYTFWGRPTTATRKELKYYEIRVREGHPNVGGEGMVRYDIFNGFIYEDGLYEDF